MKIRVGTRGSRLALKQAEIALSRFAEEEYEVSVIKTEGDIDQSRPLAALSQGAFERELNDALIRGDIDLAVHSMKDVPMDLPQRITLAAIPDRASPNDLFVSSSGMSLEELPAGSKVGTSSVRRTAQIMSQRRDLKIDWIRGNVDTRLRKVRERLYDGAIIAEAGVARLGLATGKEQRLPISKFPTSPGQGAIGVYARASDRSILERVREVNSDAHMREVLAEREFLRRGGGGCAAPLGCTARVEGGRMVMTCGLYAIDGSKFAIRTFEFDASSPAQSGRAAADSILGDHDVKGFWGR
jgi:hydroxymethylbilane synthase